VVLNNLKPIALTDRPFHCTDASNSEWYINDMDNGWKQDSGLIVLGAAEHKMNQAWSSEFKKKYPNWEQNEILQDKFVKLAGNATSKLNKQDSISALMNIGHEAKLDTNK